MMRFMRSLTGGNAATKTRWKRVALAVLLVPMVLAVLLSSSGCTVMASDGGHGGHGGHGPVGHR